MSNDEGKLHSRKPTFGKVPEELMHDLRVTDGAVRLYSHMHWRFGLNKRMFEGQRSMGDTFGVSELTISNRVRELEATDWVMTVGRGFNPKSGNFQTPFYHVFEDPVECREFRETYEAAEGETVRPRPALQERKLRKGKGGKPGNLAAYHERRRINSSKDGQLNSGLSGPLNSGKGGQLNSGLDNTDSGDTDSINSGLPDGKGGEKPSSKGKPERTRNPLFDAVVQHIFETDPQETAGYDETGGLIGAITAWLAGTSDGIKQGKTKKLVVGFISRPAEPKHVEQFAKDYKAANPNINMPNGFEKFVKEWRKWATSKRAGTKPAATSHKPFEFVPKQKGETKLSDEELAELKARAVG